MERLTAMFPLCSLTKSDGNRCASPALKGANFCFQHMGGSVSALSRARATTSGPNARLNFVYPGDREAIQHNLFLVAQALSDGKIDTPVANTYNRIFRTCELNLRRWEAAKSKSAQPMIPVSEESSEPGGEHGAEVKNQPGSAPSNLLDDQAATGQPEPAGSEEERLQNLAPKAREILKQLGYPYQEPQMDSPDEREQHAEFPRTILEKQNQEESHGFAQELSCSTPSSAPPCPSSSSPSIPTIPSSPRPASFPGWAPPSR